MYVKAEEMFFKILSEMTNSMPSETTNKCMIVFIEIQNIQILFSMYYFLGNYWRMYSYQNKGAY